MQLLYIKLRNVQAINSSNGYNVLHAKVDTSTGLW